MGNILNQMGLGPGHNMKIAEQIDKITDQHRDKLA